MLLISLSKNHRYLVLRANAELVVDKDQQGLKLSINTEKSDIDIMVDFDSPATSKQFFEFNFILKTCWVPR
jgi:hypothetical protein